jgi:hypothetical protein
MDNNVIILSAESYADLLIQVQKWVESDGADVSIQNWSFLSDRYSKRTYWMCVYQFQSTSYELG